MSFTVVGAGGFIGAALAHRLEERGQSVRRALRGSQELFDRPLGHVIYAVGVTADFRTRPFDTLRANTVLLADLLERSDFESLLYLSSARIYRRAGRTREDTLLSLDPSDPEDLYDLTKLTAEALCGACRRPSVRSVRLSNVVGADFESSNFIFELLREACRDGQVHLRTSLASAKDYVLIDDVLDLMPLIATAGRDSCYNLGSGTLLSHADIVQAIAACTGARWSVAQGAPVLRAPPLDIGRLRAEFGFEPRSVLDRIPALIDEYRKQ